jgi:3D (Asp-Asp-Asp) domain-containing protein
MRQRNVPPALAATIALTVAAAAAGVFADAVSPSSTAPAHACGPAPPPKRIRPITRPRWLPGTVITEYYPTKEDWFSGKLVSAPGLRGRHRVDWLYSSGGLAMEGQGIGRDGRWYHFAGPYSIGWVNPRGRATTACPDGSWTRGWPAWLSLGWRNARGAVTFPLGKGGWSEGRPTRFIPPPPDLRFARGPSRRLTYWRSAAVDPRLIALGSRIFIPAYCSKPGDGWFVAQDTGGAILVRHVDVYRPPPDAEASGRMLRGQKVFVVPPGTKPRRAPRCQPSGRARRAS